MVESFWALVASVLVVLSLIAIVRLRNAVPDAPPLEVDPEDPMMVEARAKARGTLTDFKRLLEASPHSASVKLCFVSSSGVSEFLWAEVLEVLSDSEFGVRLVTPPVTHTGSLERLHRCSIDDIEDWQVRGSSGEIHGGFTQRAMFAIARRDGIKLPPFVLKHEREYIDS